MQDPEKENILGFTVPPGPPTTSIDSMGDEISNDVESPSLLALISSTISGYSRSQSTGKTRTNSPRSSEYISAPTIEPTVILFPPWPTNPSPSTTTGLPKNVGRAAETTSLSNIQGPSPITSLTPFGDLGCPSWPIERASMTAILPFAEPWIALKTGFSAIIFSIIGSPSAKILIFPDMVALIDICSPFILLTAELAMRMAFSEQADSSPPSARHALRTEFAVETHVCFCFFVSPLCFLSTFSNVHGIFDPRKTK